MLKKVEELTLYAIEQEKKYDKQNKKLLAFKKKMEALMQVNNKLLEELLKGKSKEKKAANRKK